MNRIYLYINVLFLLLLTGAISSCQNDSDMLGDGKAGVNLTLQIGEQLSPDTRATIVDDLNEGVINTVDIFFYKDGATVTDAPIFYVTGMELPKGTMNRATLNISIPVDKYEELFDPETTCKVYAIANRPSATTGDNALPADDLSIPSLKNATILHAPGFAVREGDTKYSPKEQDDFVMDGEATVTKVGDALSGTIKLSRVAAKISVVVEGDSPLLASSDNTWYVAEKDGDGNIKKWWKANINDVRISMNRGSVRTKLGTTPTEYLYTANKTNDIFSLSAISLDKVTESVENKTTSLSTTIPFYTYPTNWKNDENSRTHFILVVQWTETDNPTDNADSPPAAPQTIQTYYEVNVNAAASYTERNHHYRIKQKIGVLGSTEVATAVELKPSYTIVEWGSAKDGVGSTDSHGSLNRFRFLVVDETNVVMDNTYSRRIPFFSSDPIDLSSATIKWTYNGGNTKQILTFATMTNNEHFEKTVNSTTKDITYTFNNAAGVTAKNASNQNITIPNRIQGNDSDPNHDYRVKITVHNANSNDPDDESYIYVEHKLNNEMEKNSDYSEYYIDFKVQHSSGNSDDANYNETISITQYPMLYVIADQNSDYSNDDKVNGNEGFVYINGTQGASGTAWNGVSGMTQSQNPNRYVINVAALTIGATQYIIGDPRSRSISNPNGVDASDGTRTLQYYHPTNATNTENVISPQYMFASSYSACTNINMSKEDAIKRCAAYQEDGYPAGRWRLPTAAEMKYVAQLCSWGIVPNLFSNTYDYWSAQGSFIVNSNTGIVTEGDNNALVRCVYDTWYWGTEQLADKEKFTWGDKAVF